MTEVTFIGIGAIGLPMALRLAECGHRVTAVDPFDAARTRASGAGMSAVPTLADAPRTPIVIVMVATGAQLKDLIERGGDAVDGRLWVVMSTVGPDAIAAASDRLAARGCRVVDAPVTGGAVRAKTGDLVIFASGDADAVVEASVPLSDLGTVRTVGEKPGDGQAVKVINQHLCAVHIVAAAEALNLAGSLGLDPAAVLDLVSGGAGGSWMLSDRGPRMLLDSDAPVMSQVDIFVKDSGLVADAAAASNAEVPLLEVARQRYLAAQGAGLGRRDDSRVIETYR
jgi:3-hydroxyisobutyrate dehydrogenase-like beta-hydroxyacid dehydrogenase